MREKEVLFVEPVFKEMIWGGNRMKEEFGYVIPGDHTGECWAISAHKNGDCKIQNGEYEGCYLSELWSSHRELFGGTEGDKFPLLIKIIDAKENLSIQVHPDDEYAKVHENGSFGKTECWYILDCSENATIIIGHNAGSKKELQEMIERKEWDQLIREIPIKKGDFLQIDPGTVHAIKGGTMILETQQNSDITYRVYDYDRLSDGKPRELHLEKSIDVIRVPHQDTVMGSKDTAYGRQGEKLISCSYYDVWKLSIKEKETFFKESPFLLMSVIDGKGSIDGISVKKGDHFILPYGYDEFTLEGAMDIICSGTNA